MLFTNASQFAVLLLMLVVGWLFGFASHPGGRKWKQALRDEQAARAALETRNAALTAERDSARAAAAPVVASAARPATTSPAKPAWIDRGSGDDLTRLRGVDADLARRLEDQGVTTYSEIADLNGQDEIALERRIDLPAGYIQREQLREQARLLADRDDEAHGARFA